jgi:hypothetical protein
MALSNLLCNRVAKHENFHCAELYLWEYAACITTGLVDIDAGYRSFVLNDIKIV